MKSQTMAKAKVAGNKRSAEEVAEMRPEKRQKINTIPRNRPCGGTEDEIPEKERTTGSNQVSRFLDLPGEIRNRIYEIIAEISYKSFPHTYPKRRPLSKDKYHRPPIKPLPFIGLTQTCILIRKEFRPIWLSTHCFPPFALEGYFKAFFPLPTRVSQANQEMVQRRMGCYHNPAGTLRIRVSEGWEVVTDMLPLLKFRLRFPMYSLIPIPGHTRSTSEPFYSVLFLINNTNMMWTWYIKQHVITQVLLRENSRIRNTDPLRIVIKERHAPNWMRAMSHNTADVEEYVARLGLRDLPCKITLGVDYS